MRKTTIASAVACLSLAFAAAAQPRVTGNNAGNAAETPDPGTAKIAFNIAGQPLNEALNTFTQQARLRIVFDTSAAEGVTAPAVTGNLTAQQALQMLLAPSDLIYRFMDEHTLAVEPPAKPTADAGPRKTPLRLAQAESPPQASAETLEEIIVTAERRAERLQDVPVAVTAVLGNALASAGLGAKLDDLQYVVPSLQFSGSSSPSGAGFSVRGVGTVTFNTTSEQSVGLVRDGVVMSTVGQGVSGLVDVDRVEVLRGPQGLLFGKNASAGVISIITKRPQLTDTEFVANLSYGSENETRLQGVINVPVTPFVATRIAGYYNFRDPFVTNVVNGEKYNGIDEFGFITKLLWEPTEKFSAYLIGNISEADANCCIWTMRQYGLASGIRARLEPLGVVAGPENEEVALDGPVRPLVRNNRGVSLELNYQTDYAGTITALSAYQYYYLNANFDSDQMPVNFLNLNNGTLDVDQYSQELRIASPSGGKLEYVAGLFYLDVKSLGTTLQVGSLGQPDGLLRALNGGFLVNDYHNKNAAAFGQMTFHLTDGLSLIAGGRYTYEDSSLIRVGQPVAGAIGSPPPRFEATQDSDGVSWRLGAQYQFSRDLMTYATVSRGYKGPAVIAQVTGGFTRAEVPTSYELGLKSTLFDQRMVLNLAVFDTKFRDFQAQTFVPAFTSFVLSNAGGLRSRGVEAEFTARVSHGLTLQGGVTYNDAKFTDFLTRCPNGVAGCSAPYQARGQKLPNAPEWVVNLGATYERPIANGLVGRAQANYRWKDDYYYIVGDTNSIQSGFGLMGASIGIHEENERWAINLFARNLFGRHFVDGIPLAILEGQSYRQYVTADSQRTIGVMLDVRF